MDFMGLEFLMIIATEIDTEQKSTLRLIRNPPFIMVDESENTPTSSLPGPLLNEGYDSPSISFVNMCHISFIPQMSQ